MKNVVIIGSGIGGSGIGALLTNHVKVSITLLEQNDIIGGRCGSYYKYDDEGQKFKMDVGCHIFNTAGKGPLGQILKDIDRPNAVKWEPVRNPGPKFAYKGTFFNFPKEARKVGIKRKTVNDMIALMMTIYSVKPEEIPALDEVSLISFLDQHTKNFQAKSLFSVQGAACFGLPPQDVSAGEYVRMIQDNINARSLGYCRGGTGAIPEAYVDRIKDADGKIITGDEGRVSKIVIENNTAIGVEHGLDKNYIPADIVIANSDIKSTVLKLVGEKYFENKYIRYIKDLIWGGRGCSLKLALNKKVTPYKMITYLPPGELEEGGHSALGNQSIVDNIRKGIMPDQTGLLINVTSNFDPGLCPEGYQIILTATLTQGSEASPELERKYQKVCMKSIVALFPEIEDSLVIEEFVSNSYLREKMGKEGSSTGIGQCVGQVGTKRPSQVAPVRNLYFSSCDAGGYGVGTELGAQSALDLFAYMKKNKIIELI
ncbi:MAG: NAD(P)/FAD-dependent oxidoreductase [Candidatus Helarchaeota archaeon]|nr:NAD(P)/FAD-dependent oxidoreductase [Candidatus Helarchaeota archaeon]